MRWNVINEFIEKNEFQNYLEIGYYKGWSFDNVHCKNKTAVDPYPCKTLEQEQWQYRHKQDGVIKMTSDDFFEQNKEKFQICFVDGLHEWQQVYKDIENCMEVLEPNGIIVLHDCNPPRFEHTTTGIDGCWTGDTYKALMKFQMEYNNVFYTHNFDWGVGVIILNQVETKLEPEHYEKAMQSWEYFDEHRNKLLNLR